MQYKLLKTCSHKGEMPYHEIEFTFDNGNKRVLPIDITAWKYQRDKLLKYIENVKFIDK